MQKEVLCACASYQAPGRIRRCLSGCSILLGPNRSAPCSERRNEPSDRRSAAAEPMIIPDRSPVFLFMTKKSSGGLPEGPGVLVIGVAHYRLAAAMQLRPVACEARRPSGAVWSHVARASKSLAVSARSHSGARYRARNQQRSRGSCAHRVGLAGRCVESNRSITRPRQLTGCVNTKWSRTVCLQRRQDISQLRTKSPRSENGRKVPLPDDYCWFGILIPLRRITSAQ